MIQGLAFVEVVVEDFDAMIEWYTEVLGFKHGEDKSNADRSECWQELLVAAEPNEAGGTAGVPGFMALWKPVKPSQKPEPDSRARPCFLPILRVRDIDSFVEHLRRVEKSTGKKILLEEVRDRGSFFITTIVDLEGNRLQLYEEKTKDMSGDPA